MLSLLPRVNDKNLLIGIDTSDDAAVYKLSDDIAVIQTIDFFTPVVDDPYTFGQIAAANALSDVYAMGGKPVLALNIACFPSCMDMNILGEIMKGGADKVAEAGAVIAGGHTVDDKVPKYGLAVMGTVHPDKITPNSGAKPGDVLILTKPIGTGVINTAIKGEIAEPSHMDAAIKVMAELNKYAAEAAEPFNINGCTDITGFGLIGHMLEMAQGGDVTIHLMSKNVQIVDGAEEYASMGLIPAGAYRNRKHAEGEVKLLVEDNYMVDLLYDPQTSGGLLYSLPEDEGDALIRAMASKGVHASVVGYVTELQGKHIIVE